MLDLKVCISCKESKEKSFYSLKRGKPTARCKVCKARDDKIYRLNNVEKERTRQALHWKQYKGTERQKLVNRKKCKTWQVNNLAWFTNYMALRRTTILHATPNWADLEEIKLFYKACPKGYHVDHIIPLKNKIVCGLHTEANLQYLPAQENLRKSNKFNN